MAKQLNIFVFLFLVSAVGFGQVEFKAKVNKKKIGLNERLRVEFEMNENGDNFKAPNFEGFKVYGGPRQSISQSWTNGVNKFSKTYTYYLEPEERGTLKIGQATVEIDGKEYKTSPQEIEVTAAVDEPKDENDEDIPDVSEDIHIVTEISNENPYLNEGISVVYKLYVSQNASVSDWRVKDSPKFSNFWSQDIDTKFQIKYGSYKGEDDYRYVELKKTLLYPQKTGKLTIEPMSLDFSVEVPTNKRDFFGRPQYKSVEKTLSSKSREIDVKPLPDEGKPESFSGAVGQFDFKVSASKDELEVDESMDATVEVSGKGNLKIFDLPELQVPSALEAYDPEHSENVSTTLGGTEGSLSDTYTLVADANGEYTLEPMEFSFFDPKAERYRTLTSDALKVNITGGESKAVASSEDTTAASSQKQRVVSTGNHFQYIKLKTKLHALNRVEFFKSKLFWALLFLPIVLLPVAIGVGKKHKDRVNDLYGNRIRRADRLARKYLSEAKKTMGDQKAYYEALERALHNFLRANLDMQTSEMKKARIAESLQEKGVEEETSNAFIKLLESCEFARYTPPSNIEMQQDYDKASEIISEVDKQMRA